MTKEGRRCVKRGKKANPRIFVSPLSQSMSPHRGHICVVVVAVVGINNYRIHPCTFIL